MPELITAAVPTKFDKLDSKVYKVDYGDAREVEIGESKESKFKPYLYFKHWDEECWFKVTPRGNFENNTPTETKESLDITALEILDDSGNESIKCYPVDKDDYQEDGGFEFETILQKKPTSNEIIYDLDFSTNISFRYQPPYNEMLNVEDPRIVKKTMTTGTDKNGKVLFSMPDRAVGSYVLHRRGTKKLLNTSRGEHKYKTGKLMHIWRPKIIDAKGSWSWGELKINDDEKWMKVTVEQSFLDKAVYPVRVDPTFGYTTLGASNYNIQNLMNGHVGDPGEAGEVTSFHVGMHSDWDSGDNIKMALYDEDDDLVSPQSEELSGGHSTAQFVQLDPTSGTASVTSQEYRIMAWSDSDANMRVDYSGSLGDSRYYSSTYGSWPSSIISGEWAWEFSTYATFTADVTDPTITNASDEDFHPDEEDIDVDGTNFEATQGTGKIELGSHSTYSASTTKVSQTVNSWSDTQINIDIVMGALSEGNLWLYVTNDSGGTNENGYQVSVTTPSPTITDAGDEDFYNGEENVIVTGTDFGFPIKGGKIEIGNASTYAGSTTKVTQTVNSWADTSLDIDIVRGALSLGSNWLYVTHDSGDVSAGYAITLSAPPTEQIFTTPGTDTFTVPAGVTEIEAFIWAGGGGGAGGGTDGVGGDGAGGGFVRGKFSVTPAQVLDLHVGGGGANGDFGGTYSGDGGGGGGRSWLENASDVMMMVAGAGGGGGGGDNSSATAGGGGGEGGGTNGVAGGDSSDSGGGGGATGGTGGTGGVQSGSGASGAAGQDYDGTPAGAGGEGGEGSSGTGGGSAANGGTTNGGDAGEGDNVNGYAGGGGGGAGYAGGGGGAGSASGDAGAGGGGGGSNYLSGSVTEQTNSQASGQTPPGTGLAEYSAGVGVGGDGGAISSSGTNGGNGRIVIKWGKWPHDMNGVDNSSIAKINGVAITSIARVNGVE